MNHLSLLRLFQKLYTRTSWSLSFLPEEGSFQWAIIKDGVHGPRLYAYGSDLSAKRAMETLPSPPDDALYLSSVFLSLPTLCRQLSFPKLAPKELSSAISDTLEQSLSGEATNAFIAHEAHPNDQGGITVTAYVARKEPLRSHVDLLQKEGIDPEMVFPKAACLAAFISFFALEGWSYVVDVSKKETSAVLILNGVVVENRALIGGMDLFSCIEKPSSSSDKQLHQLLQHIGETLLAYQERYSLPETVPLTITGGLISHPEAISTISDFIGSPLSSLHSLEDTSLLSFAPVIGGAFLSRPQASQSASPNLRTKELSFTSPLRHIQKPLFIALGASFALCASLGWYGHTQKQMITQTMNAEWKNISQTAQIQGEEELFSSQEIVENAEQLLDSLEKKALFPLQPNIPLVSDLLTWLSEQVSLSAQKHTSTPDKIVLQSLNYVLVKRPNKKNPKERYKVRVTLEIDSSSVALARAFHDTLLAKNDFVDPLGGVKWSEANGKYSTTFFLKDKTFYPQGEL
jgi:type IV pilus assembly protein PilM